MEWKIGAQAPQDMASSPGQLYGWLLGNMHYIHVSILIPARKIK